MIFVQDKRVKVGKYYLPGEIQAIRVEEAGKLEDKKKGKKKLSNQPTGYEAATVEIDMIFEENGTYNLENMLRYVQRMFKTSGQKKQKKYKIVAAGINARGITEAYFNGFSTEMDGAQSWVTGTLSFVAPAISGLSVVKTKKQLAKASTSNKTKKTKKNTSKSPVKSRKSTAAAKKKAKKLVKQ